MRLLVKSGLKGVRELMALKFLVKNNFEPKENIGNPGITLHALLVRILCLVIEDPSVFLCQDSNNIFHPYRSSN